MASRITSDTPPIALQQPQEPDHPDNGITQHPQRRRTPTGTRSLIDMGRNAPVLEAVQGQGTQRGHVRELQQTAPETTAHELDERAKTALGAERRHQAIQPHSSHLDRRQNPVDATVRESRWAIALWNNLPTPRLELFIEHLAFLLESVRQFERKYHRFAHRLAHEDAREELLERFAAAYQLEALLEQWAENPRANGQPLCEMLLGNNGDFKGMVDTLQLCMGVSGMTNKKNARECSFFMDRGRRRLPRDRRHPSSEESPHGGITDSRNRSPSMENLFSESLRHAKGILQRNPDSETAQRFKHSGTPLIGGASGSIETLVLLMEVRAPKPTLSELELTERERIIVLHSALLIYGGHHSLMECLLPARAYGYFREIPNPLRVGYTEASKAFDASVKELGMDLGMDPGVSLVE